MGKAERIQGDWPEAMAEVTGCHYDVRAGRALAFGLPSNKHFRISYNYQVGDDLHTGEYFSETARVQGSLFPIRFDPDLPHLSHSGSSSRQPVSFLVAVVAGSIALSLVVLLVLRGC